MRSNKRGSIDPLRVAWLLRADLRRGAAAADPVSDWFRMWWLINGPREYPAWVDHEALQGAGLFTPMADWPRHGGFGMTPALSFLLETRKDLAHSFDVGSDEGMWQAIAWLFVHGIREHKLLPALDAPTLAALDTVPPIFPDSAGDAHERPEITWLMFFVWRTSADLQQHFDLRRAADRQSYLIWFLQDGVPQLQLAPMLAPRWRAWLREPVLAIDSRACVPRAAYLLWTRHQQLQRAFRLETKEGIAAMAMWAGEVWRTQPELSWIDPPAPPAPQPVLFNRERPFGLNLIGFAFGELGIGEDVRMAVAACEAAGIPFTVVNIHPGDTLRQADLALANHVAQSAEKTDIAPYAFNLFCLTAFDTARAYLERGLALFEGRHNIGWWPWELPVWPRDWSLVYDLVDHVWAATSFTHRMYTQAATCASATCASATPTPVTLVPMPASVDRVKPLSRLDLDLPADRYLFLYVFDFNSYLARKNPFATVKSFRKAFDSSDDSVGLVLKTMNANPDNPEWKRFMRECGKDSRIIVLDRTMERGEVLGLIRSCDAYVSLHRAEGFGRTLVEAMLFGKPVVATDFSGNTDFLTNATGYPVKWKRRDVKAGQYAFVARADKAWWAEPDIANAAYAMRRAKAIGARPDLAEFAKEKFSPQRLGKLMFDQLSRLQQEGQSGQLI